MVLMGVVLAVSMAAYNLPMPAFGIGIRNRQIIAVRQPVRACYLYILLCSSANTR
jgi:hypothetical protein